MSSVNQVRDYLPRGGEATRFQKGKSGYPGGDTNGFTKAKRAIYTGFLKALKSDFEEHGEAAIQSFRTEHVDKYCQMIADFIPVETTLNVNNTASPALERLSGDIEWLRGAIESARAKTAAPVSVPERPLLSAPLHAEEGGR